MNRWLRQMQADPIATLEDPAEDVHVSNLVAARGNIRLFQGHLDSVDYYLASLLRVLQLPNRLWARSASAHVHAVLSISEAMAHRARLDRNTFTDGEPRSEVRISAAEISDLCQRVTFSPADLATMNVSVQDLAPFLLDPRSLPDAPLRESVGHTSLERRPLLLLRQHVVAILPHAVGPAAQRYVIERVLAEGHRHHFTRTLTELQVKELLSLARHNWGIQLKGSFHGDAASGVADGVGLFDLGAYVHLIYVPDDLDAISRSGLESTHPLGAEVTQLSSRIAMTLGKRPDYRRGLTLLVHGGVGRPFVVGFKTPPENWRILCLSIADFDLLAWDTGNSALRLWKLLDQKERLAQGGLHFQNVGGFMDLYGYLQAQDFAYVPPSLSVAETGSVAIWPAFAGSLRRRLRTELDRHGTFGIDGKTTIEVQRKSLGPSIPIPGAATIYASRDYVEQRELFACVETGKRPWWIHASGRGYGVPTLLVIYGVWESTVNLLSRLAPLFEKKMSIRAGHAIVYRMRFPDISNYAGTIDKNPTAPAPPQIEVRGHTATIDYLAAHLQRFARADNVADRDLAGVLVRGAFTLANESIPNEDVVKQWIDRVIPSGHARSFHITPVRTAAENIYSSVALPEPRLEMPEDRAWSHLRLTHDAGYKGALGTLSDDVVHKVLQDAVGAIWKRTKNKLATLERRTVIERALENWETIQKERAEWQRAAAALLAIHENDDAVIGMANQRENARSMAGLASRVIAEMALCTAPYGTGSMCAAADLDELVAEVCRLLDCAGQCDAHHYKLATSAPIAHANGSLEFGRLAPATLGPYRMALGERHFRRDAAQYDEPFRVSDQSVVPEQGFEVAFRTEFGMTLREGVQILDWLTEEALRRSAVQFVLSKGDVVAKLKALGLSEPERAYRQFVLVPRRKWDESDPAGSRKKDWYPWRYNRRLSVLRRPILQLSTDEDSMVLLSPARFEQSMEYLTQAARGRLPGDMFDSRAMRQYIGRMVDKYGHEFNHQVGARCGDLGWKTAVEVPMTYFGAKSEFGDLDVVAWRKESDVVYAIECKWLRMDRTIGEVGERLTEYGVGIPRHREKMSALERHFRRVAYLRTSGKGRLVELTGRAGRKVQVRSALVTDTPAPMQFHEEHASSLDVVADYTTLDSALSESDDLGSRIDALLRDWWKGIRRAIVPLAECGVMKKRGGRRT